MVAPTDRATVAIRTGTTTRTSTCLATCACCTTIFRSGSWDRRCTHARRISERVPAAYASTSIFMVFSSVSSTRNFSGTVLSATATLCRTQARSGRFTTTFKRVTKRSWLRGRCCTSHSDAVPTAVRHTRGLCLIVSVIIRVDGR